MEHTVTMGQRLKIGLAAIFWFVLALLALISLPVVAGVSWLAVIGLVALALLVAVPVWLLRRAFSGPRRPSYWVTWLATAMVLICVVGLPIYYLAYQQEADPMILPLVTLTNGDKTVVFQGMVHIGSENFYKSVVYDLEAALADGYDLFYEGVQPGDAESQQWFSETLAGGGDLSANYKALGSLCGVQFQLDYFDLLNKDKEWRPERHVIADVTDRQMLDEWNRLRPNDPWKPGASTGASTDAATDDGASAEGIVGLVDWVKSGSSDRETVSGIVCRAMLSSSARSESSDPEKDPVILDFRNRALARQIVEYPGNKIYITYGAAHIPGVIALLEERDPAWKVVSTKWVRAMEPPQHYEGELDVEG